MNRYAGQTVLITGAGQGLGRAMAHRFADQIMLFLTGEQGPFDSQIAFVSKRGGGRAKEIYVTDLTGLQVTQITKDRTLSLGPSWNPTADKLLYFSYKQGGPYPYLVDLPSGQESRLYPVVGYSGRWSPDGTMIAVSLEQQGNSDLFLLSPEGRLMRRLTEHSDIDVSPTWSLDSRGIAFCSSRSGSWRTGWVFRTPARRLWALACIRPAGRLIVFARSPGSLPHLCSIRAGLRGPRTCPGSWAIF